MNLVFKELKCENHATSYIVFALQYLFSATFSPKKLQISHEYSNINTTFNLSYSEIH